MNTLMKSPIVIVAINDETIIVTVHDYDPEVYEPDHRTRREKR